MKKLFNNILIPFEEITHTDMTVQEAIRLAGDWPCNIHLLYVADKERAGDSNMIASLKARIQERYNIGNGTDFPLIVQQQQGIPEKTIIDYCIRHQIDLVLLAPKKQLFQSLFRPRSFVNISRLLKKLNCPVMTVFPHPPTSAIRNIVLPVGESLPMRKLLFATYLAKMAHATIHLVSLDQGNNTPSSPAPESLYRSYRLLRENTSLPVECLTIPGGNLAESTWQYAQKIKADLILIYSGKEALLSGIFDILRTYTFKGLYARALFNVSRIPVMTLTR